MIAGRPINLWTGLTTAVIGALSVTAVVLGADPTVVATLGGAWAGVVGAGIALVAVQTPTVTPGSDVTVQTPSGQPNATATLDLTRAGDLVVSSPDSNVFPAEEITS